MLQSSFNWEGRAWLGVAEEAAAQQLPSRPSVQVWVPPEQDGTICTHTHNVLVARTDLQAGDVATVAHPNVSHGPLLVVPQLHQMVVATCGGHRARTNHYREFCCFVFPDQGQGSTSALL